MNRKRYALMAVLLALLASVGCGRVPGARRPRGEVERLPRVETVTPKYLALPEKVELLATVEPMERARLSAQVQGEVQGLSERIDIGRPIKKGEPLLTLDIPAVRAELESKKASLVQTDNQLEQAREALKVAGKDVEEARAQLARHKAELDFRELALKRVNELVKTNAVQPQLRDEAELQRNSAHAAVQAAAATLQTRQARLAAAGVDIKVAHSRVEVAQSEVKLAQTRVDFATVRAPFDGVITRRWVHNGAVIRDPATPLLTVVRTDVVRVVIDVPERYAGHIRAVDGTASGEPNRVQMNIQGHLVEQPITRVAVAVSEVARLMRAEVHVKNAKDVRLKPGMTGTATVFLSEDRQRLTLPSTALVRAGDEVRVYYLDGLSGDPPRGTVKSVAVTLGLDDGKTVEIKSGLSGNEAVIAKGNGVVREGETVLSFKVRERKHD